MCDNASVPDAREVLRRRAVEAGCSFHQFAVEVLHHDFLKTCVATANGPVVICDPDIVFWDTVEDWEFEQLVGGRRIPMFFDEYTQCVTLPRLHTSLLFIRDANRFRQVIGGIQRVRFDFDPFQPVMVRQGSQWLRYDCGSTLYHALPEDMQPFLTSHLDAYDHLFGGSDPEFLKTLVQSGDRETWQQWHDAAKHDVTKLKGIWVAQDAYFRSRAVKLD